MGHRWGAIRHLAYVSFGVSLAACASSADDDQESADFDALSSLPTAKVFSAPDMGVFDAGKLAELEALGLSLHRVLGATSASAQQLSSMEPYKGVADALSSELMSLASKPRGAKMEYPLPNDWYSRSYVFNPDWLRSRLTRFELVAVVQRLDKTHQTPRACGETRLVYRLAYTSSTNVSSRLPMTMNVVFVNPLGSDGQCRTLAVQWQQRTDSDTAATYRNGPLARLGRPARIEVNLQSSRVENTNAPIIGGAFPYILKAFDVSTGSATPEALANQPRQDLSAAESAALRADIVSHAREIDTGRYVMPAVWASETATALAPGGMSIARNRPFAALIGKESELLQDLRLPGASMATTPKAFARRLEQLSCSGCHATRSMGGFHVVGREAETASSMRSKEAMLSVQVPVSNHFVESIPYRRRALAALVRGQALMESEPFAEHADTTPGKLGAHCGLGDAGLRGWSCAVGLSCVRIADDLVGQCQDASNVMAYGQACISSRINFSTGVQESYSVLGNNSTRCNTNGWPDGNRATNRNVERGTLAVGLGDQTTIAIPGIRSEINRYLLQNPGKFLSAIAPRSSMVFVAGRCDAETPCRDSYICGRVTDAEKGNGVCLPPYFMPSLQLFGHDVK